nr:fimbria/pilus periplasmic chaperone [Asticcacaulis machinosus]
MAVAGSLEIGPTRIQLMGQERTSTLTIRNTSDSPANIQVRTFDWSQAEGTDSLKPSAALLASPGLATLKPGESQVIRVVVPSTVSASKGEVSYRLVLDEIPDNNPTQDMGVRQVVRVLVPVFITASSAARPKIVWTATRTADTITLTATNTGTTRERLTNVRLTGDDGDIGQGAIEGYVLSGAERRWYIQVGAVPIKFLKLAGEGDFGSVEADVPVIPKS